MPNRIIIGSDHRGKHLKDIIYTSLSEWNKIETVADVGPFEEESVDYPEYARLVAQGVQDMYNFGVLVCGSGFGVAIAANRYDGVRAITCRTKHEAFAARLHNNANVVCIGADFTDINAAINIVHQFITAPFDGGERHVRRVEMIDELPKG